MRVQLGVRAGRLQVCTWSSAWEPGWMEAPGQGQAAGGGWVVLSAHTPRHPGTCPEVRSSAGTKAVPGRLGQLGGGRVYRPTHQLSHGARPTVLAQPSLPHCEPTVCWVQGGAVQGGVDEGLGAGFWP